MKSYFIFIIIIGYVFLVAFKNSTACEYAGFNLNFIKTQALKAIETDDINMSRFFAYKALNAIEKTKEQLNSCGCEYASNLVYKGLDDLKLATKVTSLSASKLLLNRVIESMDGSIEAIYDHHSHHEHYSSTLLELNTKAFETNKPTTENIDTRALRKKIDESLLKFTSSLNEVITTVPCEDAYTFASKVYNNCQKQLLVPNLSEGKKYYYMKTQKIAQEALEKLGDCPK